MTVSTPLTPRIGKVAIREFGVHGITTLEQVAERTPAKLHAIHGIGPKAIRLLEEQLRDQGLTWAS